MSSDVAALDAQRVFDAIFPYSYDYCAARVPHEWARHHRYGRGSIRSQLRAFLNGVDKTARSASQVLPPPRGLFEALDRLIDRHLKVEGIGHPPHHGHRTAALGLSGADHDFDAATLLQEMFVTAAKALAGAKGNGSRENWRFEKKLFLSGHNTSAEKMLEKAIARHTDHRWANQVPTSSGIFGPTNGRHRNLDLVHRPAAGCLEFIELKVNSDTPLSAAMQLIKYAVFYLAQRRQRRFAPAAAIYGHAESLILTVLAPAAFYQDYRFDWLEERLNVALSTLLDGLSGIGLSACFRFQAFPAWFAGTGQESRDEIHRALAGRENVRWKRLGSSAAGRGLKAHLAEWARSAPEVARALEPGSTMLLREGSVSANFFRPGWADLVRGQEHRYLRALNSSQAFAVNLFAPLADDPQAARDVLEALLPEATLSPGARVEVAFEYSPPEARTMLGEGEKATQVDVALIARRGDRLEAALLVEVKLLEDGFGRCRGWTAAATNPAPWRCLHLGRILDAPHEHCHMAQAEGRRYWDVLGDPRCFAFPPHAVDQPCPFRHDLYQVMRNCVLADALEAATPGSLVRVGLCLHPENAKALALVPPVAGDDNVLEAINALRPKRPVRRLDLVETVTLIAAATGDEAWHRWFSERYRV